MISSILKKQDNKWSEFNKKFPEEEFFSKTGGTRTDDSNTEFLSSSSDVANVANDEDDDDDDTRNQNKRIPFVVGILGVTGSGKSTFINSIIGRPILTVAMKICTASILKIK